MNRSRTVNPPHPIYLAWLVSCLIVCTATAVEPNRIWVDAEGLFSVEARLVEIIDEQAVLLRKDGKKITIVIEMLSVRDKEYLEDVEQRTIQHDNPLREYPLKPLDIKPLPNLDLPSADRVAVDGSSLSADQEPAVEGNLPPDRFTPLPPDPSPWTFAVCEARIPIPRVDSNDECSRPIPVMTMTGSGTRRTSIAMSVCSGVRLFGQNQRNQLIRFDVHDQKAFVALQHDQPIRLIDHHLISGRSLVLVGFNSLGKGGELAIATGWERGRIKLSHRRQLTEKKIGISPAHLRWARWVDEEHFIAVIDQTLGLWNIVSGDQVYRIDGIDHRSEPAISGGRRYVAVPSEGAVDLFATATGQPLGRIVIEKQVAGVGFSPQGNTLAVATSRRLRAWDLASAQWAADIDSRRSLGRDQPVWIDSDLVLSSSGTLLSVFRGLPVWRYDITGTSVVPVGKHVVMFRTHPVSELAVVSLPHQPVTHALQWIDNSPAEVDKQQWSVLGRSVWSAGKWDDHDVQISAAPDRLR